MNLVFVHGFFGSALNWGPVLTKVKEAQKLGAIQSSWNIQAVDLIGHGPRKWEASKGILNLDLTVKDMIEQLPEGPIVFVPHSFGTRPVLRFACQHPERVPEIWVEDASGDLSDEGFQTIKRILTETPNPFSSREDAKNFFDQRHGASSALSRFLLSLQRQDVDGGFRWRFDPVQLFHLLEESKNNPLWKEWSEYPGHLRLIVGEKSSHMNKVRIEKAIEKRKPRTLQLVQIPQAAHWVHSEQLELFTDCLFKFIKNFESGYSPQD